MSNTTNKHVSKLKDNLSSVIYGKDECIEVLITAILAGGTILMEDIPGVGKTTLAKALAASLKAKFRRIQFTPDLMPADIIGSAIYNQSECKLEFQQGPLFCNVLLADEINRASPRTQSALLEAMCEGQVTVDGVTHQLPQPFLVIATQNPIDFHGTYPLPEAQMDRFLVRLNMGYPAQEAETQMILSQCRECKIEKIAPVLDCEQLLELQQQASDVYISEEVAGYITLIALSSRREKRLRLGISPRSSLMLARAAQATALLEGRDYVTPDDVKRMSSHVLAHRIILDANADYSGVTSENVIRDIMDNVAVPV